jgi:hypothetical protein
MKQVLLSLTAACVLGLGLGCTGGSKAPTTKLASGPLQSPPDAGAAAPPAGGNPLPKKK